MSTALRDSGAARPGNSKYFWTPVLIAALGCAGVALVQITDYLDQKERSIQDAEDLAVRAMGSRSDALKVAEQRLEGGRISFSLYRDLLKSALRQQDPDEQVAAQESMDKLLSSGLAFAKDLRTDLASWPTEVLITATEAGGIAGSNIEKGLKIRGIPVVLQTSNTKGAGKTAVLCYEQKACKQTGQSVLDVLQENGYPVAEATLPKDGFDAAESAQTDDAAKLLKKKRIEIVLADQEKSAPHKQILARRIQPRVVHERQVAALTNLPAK